MELGLRNKIVLVTGASKGIGRAVAEAFVAEGSKVAITARGAEELQKTAGEISQNTGAEVVGIAADMSKADDITRADDQPQPENSDRSSSNFQSRVACWAYLCGDFPPLPENGLPRQEDPSVFRGPARSQPVYTAAANVLSLGLSCDISLGERIRTGLVIP
jgi:hypothetical protein